MNSTRAAKIHGHWGQTQPVLSMPKTTWAQSRRLPMLAYYTLQAFPLQKARDEKGSNTWTHCMCDTTDLQRACWCCRMRSWVTSRSGGTLAGWHCPACQHLYHPLGCAAADASCDQQSQDLHTLILQHPQMCIPSTPEPRLSLRA